MNKRAYISADGMIEYSPSFTSAKEILQEMDRLGICQAVLEYPLVSNGLFRSECTLDELATVPEAKGRLIPVFSLDMCLAYQKGGIERMREILQENRPCCVAIRPASGSFRLRAIDLVLEQISDLVSVAFVDYDQISKAPTAGDDLIYLARQFPDMAFVIRRFTQGGMPFVFDTVRRAKNIYMNISRLHIMGAVDTACTHLGVEKVLYGFGLRSDNGACMAAIEYADISDEDKDKICHGNFINLFKNEADREILRKNLKVMENKVQNSLWNEFMEGKGLKSAELYDCHTHIGYTAGYGYVPYLTFPDQLMNYRKHAELFNIKKIVSTVIGLSNPVKAYQEAEKYVLDAGEWFKGYIYYNPNHEEVYTDEFFAERFATGHYVGLKTLPHYMKTPITGKPYERMFQYAHDHNLPILIHTDAGPLGNPLMCAEMAARYPNAKVILGHSGLNDAGREMCHTVAQNPAYNNVYFENCGTFCSEIRLEESLKFIDYRRYLYGTDAPIHSIVWELGRLLSADIPDDQMKAILGGNTKKLFGF